MASADDCHGPADHTALGLLSEVHAAVPSTGSARSSDGAHYLARVGPRRKRRRDAADAPDETPSYTLLHTWDTSLEDVGTQLWRGALLLCDYLVGMEPSADLGTVVDLGTGVGLTAVVAARSSKAVFATDGNVNALALAERNGALNAHHLPAAAEAVIRYRQLCWGEEERRAGTGTYDWRAGELEALRLRGADVVLAADCVYDGEAAAALLVEIAALLVGEASVAYVCLEKRFNYEVATLSVVAHGYRALLDATERPESPLRAEIVDLASVPQLFAYDRVPQLELLVLRRRR